MLAEQLRAAGLTCFPCWLRYNPEKGQYDKGPAVPRGVSWKDYATQGLPCDSDVVGVPAPPRVLIIDLDTRKGVTREAVNQALGCKLDWDRALIQSTPSGGEHFAFRCDWVPRQGDSLLDVTGFDTRVAGKGFICTGRGYSPAGFGVFAMAYPDALPEIPDAARATLEVVPVPPAPPAPLPEHAQGDDQQIIEALHHIDPGCSRAEWVRIGLALRHQYHDEPDTGLDIFDRWSSGEYCTAGTPENYVQDGKGSPAEQWGSFKPEGGTTIATLFYRALQAGWTAPATFDTASAFGPGAAPGTVFNGLIERVQESGGDVRQTAAIVEEIKAAGCNALQVALLAAELKNALRDAGIKDAQVGRLVDSLLQIRPMNDRPRSFVPEISPSDLQVVTGEHEPFKEFEVPARQDFPGDDVNDAIHMLGAIFRGRLRVYAGTFYWWTGRLWEPLGKGAVKRSVGLAIRADRKKATSSRVSSIFEEMRNQAQTLEPDPPAPRVYFLNGVLDIPSGTFISHDPSNGTTRTLSVNYDPTATAPQWLSWLREIFQNEPERIELLQELIGWLLVRHTFGIEKAVLFVGPPRAGKGVIARMGQALLGSGATTFRLNELDDPKLLASLRGKHVAIDPDAVSAAPRNARSVMGLFKAITSNDPIALTLLYTQEPWQGQLDCKLLVLANSVPSMFDDSAATANRWVPLVFDRSYLGSEDPELFKRLAGELTGIAAWAVNGLLRLVNRARFSLPQSSLDQLDSLISDGGTVQDFIGECLLVGQEHRCSETELWEAYRGWAVNSGHELGKRRHVLKSLEDALRGEGVRRSKSVRLEDGRDHRGFYGAGIPPVKTARNVLAFRPSDS